MPLVPTAARRGGCLGLRANGSSPPKCKEDFAPVPTAASRGALAWLRRCRCRSPTGREGLAPLSTSALRGGVPQPRHGRCWSSIRTCKEGLAPAPTGVPRGALRGQQQYRSTHFSDTHAPAPSEAPRLTLRSRTREVDSSSPALLLAPARACDDRLMRGRPYPRRRVLESRGGVGSHRVDSCTRTRTPSTPWRARTFAVWRLVAVGVCLLSEPAAKKAPKSHLIFARRRPETVKRSHSLVARKEA